MARQSEGAWYRKAKDAWYATVGGRKVSLGVKGKANRKAAQEAWHRLMAGGGTTNHSPHGPNAVSEERKVKEADATVKAVITAFLAAKKGTVKPQTHYVYGKLLDRVQAAFGTVNAVSLKPADVLRWVYTLTVTTEEDEQAKPVSASYRNDICGVLASCFKWAEAEGLIPANPLRNMKRPPGESRGAKAVITDDVHHKLTEAAGPAFAVVLALLRETGARPSELARLTAADVDTGNAVAVLTDHKTAHQTGKARLIILTPKAVGILKEHAEARPSGPILRNAHGLPWDKDSIGHAMRRACKKAGVKAIAYGYRHTFATSALAKGVPDATVAALLGHSSTAMLHRHYSHLTSQAHAMREALAKVRG